ncbi:ABC transporter ATP-binding protein [Spiroplasma sabaudiense Ar-1343]|uniref:ABC transporter ATP-binding protein n=1 Tax=Spiroplasma sabaudiense Ar-1343 TaxID=1276257 RepID=W6A9H0_9MOLU|nr:ABC transporter ATP-binding protein/permease [Spiroplasma sabaudiense]AHI53530.1 ABC transporter ATP-binding protein [Spiroplasma sabaudiense Ar-1343]
MKKQMINNINNNELLEPIIELKNVSKNYKNKIILESINLKIYPNDRIGIIGSNGAGKSTISEIIGGIKTISSGTIVKKSDLVLGFQFQTTAYPVGITVLDMVKYYLEVFDIPMTASNLDEILKRYQIYKFKNRTLERLSGGQQQLVNILLSLIHNPDFVILDEISTGLDIEVRSEIFKIIEENIIEKNKGMLLVTHQMKEIENLCNKYIYIDEGNIKESGLVSDLIEKYGSVEEYTMQKILVSKSQIDTRKNVCTKNNKNRFNKIINSEAKKGKTIPLVKLILKYYYKGVAVPFFLFAFPIILMFLEGFAFKEIYGDVNSAAAALIIKQLTVSVATVSIIIVGISVLPQTLIEFRNSGLMKRIGSTNTRAVNFMVTTILICILFMITTFLWTMLWSGIMFGWEFGWNQILAPINIGEAIGYLVVVILASTTFGIMIASLFKSTSPTAYITISNIIFIPIAFLSGSFIPISLIEKSEILNVFSYFNPFKYSITPLNSSWIGEHKLDLKNSLFLLTSLVLVGIYGFVGFRKMNWDR